MPTITLSNIFTSWWWNVQASHMYVLKEVWCLLVLLSLCKSYFMAFVCNFSNIYTYIPTNITLTSYPPTPLPHKTASTIRTATKFHPLAPKTLHLYLLQPVLFSIIHWYLSWYELSGKKTHRFRLLITSMDFYLNQSKRIIPLSPESQITLLPKRNCNAESTFPDLVTKSQVLLYSTAPIPLSQSLPDMIP